MSPRSHFAAAALLYDTDTTPTRDIFAVRYYGLIVFHDTMRAKSLRDFIFRQMSDATRQRVRYVEMQTCRAARCLIL